MNLMPICSSVSLIPTFALKAPFHWLTLLLFVYFSAGGVELLARQGKIKVDNTLEARINMVAQNNLPSMRNALFGANPNRKFFD